MLLIYLKKNIMKKFLLIVCVCVFAASFSYAQDLKFGAKAGLNLTNIVGDDADDFDMKAGLYFGGFMNVSLNDKLSFQPELLYSMQGAKDEYKEEGMSFDETIKLSYLNIPMLLKMSLGTSNKVHVYAGPQLGFLLDAKVDIDGTDLDIKDEMNSVDFSFNLGLSYDVSDNMSLDVRYNRGLSKLGDEGDAKMYNSGFQFGAAYTF